MPHTDTPSSPAVASPRSVSPWWRAAAIFCALLLALAVTSGLSMFEQFKAQIQHLQGQLTAVPQIRYIAVLADDQQAPALLVTQDPLEGALQLQRLNAVVEGQEDSMQLWALGAGGPPRSLGVLSAKIKNLRLPASAQTLEQVTTLAISVENKGGVSESAGPRLPYLFKGAVVQKSR